MKANKELKKAFERKKDITSMAYVWLGEVAIIAILLAALLR